MAFDFSKLALGHLRLRKGSAISTSSTSISVAHPSHCGSIDPVYQAFRRRIDSALACWNKGKGMTYTFDPDEATYSQYNCMLVLLDGAENYRIAEWAPNAKDCKTPFSHRWA